MPASSIASNGGTRIPCLDGFRGLAILLVTFYRFGEVALTSEVIGKLPSKAILVGASGVDFFFALSGFLITGILLDSRDSGSKYFSRFYFRRTLRIFPLYFATLFVLLIVMPRVFGISTILDEIRGQPIHLWLYTSNLNIAWLNDWVYGPLNHFWSLAIEEQFYLVWPLVVYCLGPQKLIRWCAGLLVVFAASRIAFSLAEWGEVSEKSFTLFRLDGLLLGAIAALMVRKITDLGKMLWVFRVCFCSLLMLYAVTLVVGENDYTVRYTVVSAVATTLLLAALAGGKKSVESRFFEMAALRSLGKVSYGMYVFQAPIIPLLNPYLSHSEISEKLGNPILAGFLYVGLMFLITYCLALVSWHSFEKWILRLRNRFDGSYG